MNKSVYTKLLQSVREAVHIHQGRLKPGRVTVFDPVNVKVIRTVLGQTQREFATMIGVSVATLRNWEQRRRKPDGPALALLKVTQSNPRAVLEALHGTRKRGAA